LKNLERKNMFILEILFRISLIILTCLACAGKSDKTKDFVSLKKMYSLKESPMLTKLVKQGKLPPIEKRLPKDPKVIIPNEEPGIYGGVWHFDVVSRRDVNLVYQISNPSFIRWKQDGIHVEPYFCKHYTMSEGGRVWIFYLRKGVKWSDGHPFTSEDVRFWYEDDTLNPHITKIPRSELKINNEFGKVVTLDDYTFKVVFPMPFKAFYQNMMSIVLFYAPSHYLKQFHIKYAKKEDLERRMKEAGVKKWSELYIMMDRYHVGYYNPDRPTMRPWVLSGKTGSPNVMEFVRNPYFWAVDTLGRQLPYIDKIVVNIASNLQVLAMKTIAGNFDFQWRRLDFKDYPILKENEEKFNYELLAWPQDRCSDIALFININCIHPVAGPLLRERKFRMALSLAINREEINLIFYRNIGKPRQATASETTPFYVPEYADKYAQYNINEANRLLDELGLTKRDVNGFRLDKNGKQIILFIETIVLDKLDLLNLVSEYWKAVGLKAEAKVVEGSLILKRTQTSKVMIQAKPMGSFDRPARSKSNMIAPLFGLWESSSGKYGNEPTSVFKEYMNISNELQNIEMGEEVDLYKQMYKIYAEQVWVIGLVGEIPALLAKKNYFRNVPVKALYSYSRGRRLQLTHPEQYWIDPTIYKEQRK
jgi:peptide/nickel transport system substrate-binding protein